MDRHPHKIIAVRVLSLDDLPDSIIEKILTHLPIGDAAKTSILSKKWKNHWRNIPALVFDHSFSRSLPIVEQVYSLLHMSQVLLCHRGPIHKLTLSFDLEGCHRIDNVMLFLCDKDVHEFTFDLFAEYQFHKMPSYLFAYQQLQLLHLAYCEFLAPPTFEGFPHLISLTFYQVNFGSVECNTFISKCPLLEDLSMYDCDNISQFKIDAPKLKSLLIVGRVRDFLFNNTPLLSSVDFHFFDDFGNPSEGLTSKLISFFECLPVVERYRIRITDLKFLPEGKLLTSPRLPITISHLKVLEVFGDLSLKSDLSLVLALIISSPNLQKLNLQGKWVHYAQELDPPKVFEWEDLSDVTFQKLLHFQMSGFLGTSVELGLIKFMLAKSVVLETLTLKVRDEYEHNISIAVANFVPASPKVNINLVNGYKW